VSQNERLEELGKFLKDRRARIRPSDAGLRDTARRRVPGLRREEVTLLAGIVISWYTALEHGTAAGVSEETLLALAGVFQLSVSERHYMMSLRLESGETEIEHPGPLLIETLNAIVLPAYIITAAWDVLGYNAAFGRVWGIEDAPPFNAIERLFMHPSARAMHGTRFVANITPVIAMLRSGVGRRPTLGPLQRLRDRLLADDTIRKIWEDYEVSSPWIPTPFTIESPIGTFSYQTLDLSPH
jgi:transcriptional regulator with XRE-family HTH domain